MAVLEELLEPISDDRPGGIDIFYEDDFARIQKLRGVGSGDGGPDHATVVTLASRLLQEKSKDLRVALYLSEALLATDGFAGLQSGLEVVNAILVRFWDHAFPEDPEDRAYALDFLEGGLSADQRTLPDIQKEIDIFPLTAWGHHHHHYKEWRSSRGGEEGKTPRGEVEEDGDTEPSGANFGKGMRATGKDYYKELDQGIRGCRDAVAALEEIGQEKFQGCDFIPRYGKLKSRLTTVGQAVEALLAIKLEEAPDPVVTTHAAPGTEPLPVGGSDAAEPAAAAPAEGSLAIAAGGGPAGTAATSGSGPASRAVSPEPRDAADAAERIAQVARFLRRQDPTDPSPYLILRSFRWGELRRAAGGVDVRLLTAPETALRTRLRTLLLDEAWEDLLDACEEVMAGPCGRGWLDLQRYVMTALDNLGPSYAKVARAVEAQVEALCRDVPGILESSLMDDTPTANAQTLVWLERIGLAEGAGEKQDERREPDYDRQRLLAEATHERALAWVASGNPRKAIELLKTRSDHEDSERARFITQSLAASVMVDAGMTSVARPLLDDLVSEIKARKLDGWERADIVARPLGLLYRCVDPDDRQRKELYDQICRLDPVMAIALEHEARDGAAADDPEDQPEEPLASGPAKNPTAVRP